MPNENKKIMRRKKKKKARLEKRAELDLMRFCFRSKYSYGAFVVVFRVNGLVKQRFTKILN